MLFSHSYKADFFALLSFYYILMYILNLLNDITKWQYNNPRALYLKTIIDEMDLLMKNAISQWEIKKIRYAVACN